MIGRLGCQTMETIGGSSASYLARTPCVSLSSTLFTRVGNSRAFRLPWGGRGIISIVRWNLRPIIFGVDSFGSCKNGPTVPEGHKHRVTTPGKPCKIPWTPAEPFWETPAEPSERQISSESLAEGCAPRMVTLRNFRKWFRRFPVLVWFLVFPRWHYFCSLYLKINAWNVNKRQLLITHLFGTEPILESYDVFWCFWTFPVEIAQRMTNNKRKKKYVYIYIYICWDNCCPHFSHKCHSPSWIVSWSFAEVLSYSHWQNVDHCY